MAKSKFFRCFVAGATISDGRQITPEMIDEIVETFNVETYTPRINIEHISGYSPEPPFNGYGSVIAVRAQVDDIVIDGKTEKRKALYAQVDGNKQLVKLAADDQKPFPSVELTPSYAGINKVGLIGLAFTDKPASIATEKLKFSCTAPGSIFASADEAVTIEFDEASADPKSIADAIKAGFASIAARFSTNEEKPEAKPEPKTPPAANDNFAAFATAIGDQLATAVEAATKPLSDALVKHTADFASLKEALETTEAPGGTSRPKAPGGANYAQTDF